jgi:hypothetical protein
MSEIDFAAVVPKFDAILARGLSNGLGRQDGQMCIEAAICAALDLPHGDDPACVDPVVRQFKIRLNDKAWSSPQARAAGLRDLGIAQLGSKGTIDGRVFATKLAEQLIRVLIPTLFREVFPTNAKCLAAADRCEREGTQEAAREARSSAYAAYAAAYAAYAAAYAASADAYAASAAADAAYAAVAAAAYAAYAAAAAADAAAYASASADAAAADAASASASASADAAAVARSRARDRYLTLMATLARDVLRELKSPGAVWLDAQVSA